MKTEGLILDHSDIIQESKMVRGTAEMQQIGKLKLITTNPTETIEVKINADLWNGGKAGELLKQCVGKRMFFDIEYRKFSFGNDEGKHVSMDGFHLFALPELNQQK